MYIYCTCTVHIYIEMIVCIMCMMHPLQGLTLVINQQYQGKPKGIDYYMCCVYWHSNDTSNHPYDAPIARASSSGNKSTEPE